MPVTVVPYDRTTRDSLFGVRLVILVQVEKLHKNGCNSALYLILQSNPFQLGPNIHRRAQRSRMLTTFSEAYVMVQVFQLNSDIAVMTVMSPVYVEFASYVYFLTSKSGGPTKKNKVAAWQRSLLIITFKPSRQTHPSWEGGL